MIIIKISFDIIKQTIIESHKNKYASGGYLHTNSEFDLNESSNRIIYCALDKMILSGIDNHYILLNKYNKKL